MHLYTVIIDTYTVIIHTYIYKHLHTVIIHLHTPIQTPTHPPLVTVLMLMCEKRSSVRFPSRNPDEHTHKLQSRVAIFHSFVYIRQRRFIYTAPFKHKGLHNAIADRNASHSRNIKKDNQLETNF